MLIERRPSRKIRMSPSGHSRPWDAVANGRLHLVRVMIGLAVLVGCEEVLVNPVPVATIRIVPASAEVSLDESLELRAELYDESDVPLSGRAVTWQSDNPSIVSVDDHGLAVGVGAGTVEITAMAEGKMDTAFIVVLAKARIDLDPTSVAFSVTGNGRESSPVDVMITNGGAGSLTGLSATTTYEEGTGGWLDVVLASSEAPTTMTLTAQTGSLDGGTYIATVLVTDGSVSSSPLKVTLQVQRELPTAPSNLQATDISASAVALAWSDNSNDETGFQLERQAPGEGEPSLFAALDPDVTTYRDETVTADGRYLYRVRACSSAGCSSFSNQLATTTPPTSPSDITAEATGNTTVDVSWVDNSSTETEFRVERRANAGNFLAVGSVETNSTAFSDTGLEPGKQYEYRVRACNAAGCSSFSGVASVITTQSAGPSAPSGLSAVAVSVGQIDLAWTDNATNESEFRVERAIGQGSFTVIASLGTNATSYADTDVSADTDYSYRIRACNSADCSGPSAVAGAVTPPISPSDLTASAVSNTRIEVTWSDNSRTEASFRVERRTGSANFAEVAVTGPDVTGHTSSDLQPSTEYDFRVRACNPGGCSPYSAVASATTAETDPPAAPSSLMATLDGTAASVELAWTDNSTDETSFRIQRSVDGGTFVERATVGANTTVFTDTEITDDNVYTYRVEACSAVGCSGFSNEASVTTRPVAPSSLGAAVVTAGQVDLSWVDNSDTETEFEIQRSADGGAFTVLQTAAADATGASDNTTVEDTEYVYRVRACNATGCSAFSGEVTAITPPSPPSGLTATPSSDSRIDLVWTDNSDTETGFEIDRRESGGTFAEVTSVGANVTTFGDTGLDPNTTYEYRVRACNGGGCSDYSNIDGDTTEALAPAAPSGLTATALPDSTIDVTWNDVATEDRYELERSTDGTTFSSLVTLDADDTDHTDTGLNPGTTYHYRVRACSNTDDCSAYSNVDEATAGAPPAAPSGLTATALSDSEIELTWTDNSDNENSYRVEWSENGTEFDLLVTLSPNSIQYMHTGLEPNTLYYYRVQACRNSGGCSAYAGPVSATTDEN